MFIAFFKMKKLLFILLTFVFFSSYKVVLPDQSEEANAHVKAIYIYNFTKYIEWPQDYKDGNFVVGVMGTNTALLNELTKMASSKTVGSQKIEIQTVLSAVDAPKCNIIYILSDNSGQLADVTGKLKGKSTLIVTDKPGMAKLGSAINFVIFENKQKIELNKANIDKYKLKVASTLVEMAIQIK